MTCACRHGPRPRVAVRNTCQAAVHPTNEDGRHPPPHVPRRFCDQRRPTTSSLPPWPRAGLDRGTCADCWARRSRLRSSLTTPRHGPPPTAAKRGWRRSVGATATAAASRLRAALVAPVGLPAETLEAIMGAQVQLLRSLQSVIAATEQLIAARWPSTLRPAYCRNCPASASSTWPSCWPRSDPSSTGSTPANRPRPNAEPRPPPGPVTSRRPPSTCSGSTAIRAAHGGAAGWRRVHPRRPTGQCVGRGAERGGTAVDARGVGSPGGRAAAGAGGRATGGRAPRASPLPVRRPVARGRSVAGCTPTSTPRSPRAAPASRQPLAPAVQAAVVGRAGRRAGPSTTRPGGGDHVAVALGSVTAACAAVPAEDREQLRWGACRGSRLTSRSSLCAGPAARSRSVPDLRPCAAHRYDLDDDQDAGRCHDERRTP